MASINCQIYNTLFFLNLFQISRPSLVTFYENQDFEGPALDLDVEYNTCHNIPNTWSSRIGSINTYGSCFYGWNHEDCAGNKEELNSGPLTTHNLGLEVSYDPLEIKSTSLCSTKIYGSDGHPNNQKELWKIAASEHNKYRKRHSAPFLRSDDLQINNMAQKYADYLAHSNIFEHSPNSREYGENLAWTSKPKNKNDAVKEAVKNWYNEEKLYNYDRPGFNAKTGHFTALVWKNTKYVGIGVAWSPQERWWVVVANYFPPGNIQTQFSKNVQRPH